MFEDCIFCRIAGGEMKVPLVAESDDAVAFRDVNPQARVHVLVVPRKHVASLDQANDAALLGSLMSMAAQVARSEGISESGYRTVVNTGPDGGQSVNHLHLHVIGGKPLGWPPFPPR
ncbi:MAG: histidine triad nucleotide-binding protein [Gemmatimonadales bacterium]